MGIYRRSLSRDPSRINEVLERMCDEFQHSLGSDLEAVVLYGDLVKTGKLETDFDHANILIVLRHTDHQTLDQCVPAVEKAEHEIPLALMVLTREDLRSSCDVFPIKFHMMQQHHEVLYGEDVFSELDISDDHLRLRCEQQLKNLMLRMRSVYLHRSRNEHQLVDTLNAVRRDLLLNLHACHYLKTGIVPEEDVDLASQFAVEFGIPTKVIGEIAELNESGPTLTLEELKKLYDRLMTLIHDAAKAIDLMGVSA